jgi:hypothetical protein
LKLNLFSQKAAEKSGDEIFNMDDVSSDDELANIEMRMPNLSPRMAKSISLSMMDETAESRQERTSQWALSQSSFGHPFSDTDMSPLVR